jgi:hypothetical protein
MQTLLQQEVLCLTGVAAAPTKEVLTSAFPACTFVFSLVLKFLLPKC